MGWGEQFHHRAELADVRRQLDAERQATAHQTRVIADQQHALADARHDLLREKRVNGHLRQALELRDAEVKAHGTEPVQVARWREYAERLEAEVVHYQGEAYRLGLVMVECGVRVEVAEFGADQLGVPAAKR